MILQGSFPGGTPHSSILLNVRNDYLSKAADDHIRLLIQRHPNNIIIQQKRSHNNSPQYYQEAKNCKTYPFDITKINFLSVGMKLPRNVLQKMEKIFNADFRNVRIHTNDGQAEALGALAFTAGRDIYFAGGRYNPYSKEGLKLLGHELTHVVQQKEGRTNYRISNYPAVLYNPELETEAERMGLEVQRKIESITGNYTAGKINKTLQFAASNEISEAEKSFYEGALKDTKSRNEDSRNYGLLTLIKLGKEEDISSLLGQNKDWRPSLERYAREKNLFEDRSTKIKIPEAMGNVPLLALVNSGVGFKDSELIDMMKRINSGDIIEEDSRNGDVIKKKILEKYKDKFDKDSNIFNLLYEYSSKRPTKRQLINDLAQIREWMIKDFEFSYKNLAKNRDQNLEFCVKRYISIVKIDYLRNFVEYNGLLD
jgi:hypothetical protein